jgi:hypothetical protein
MQVCHHGMKEGISRFMDGMEAQELCGFNDLHCLLGRLQVPIVKAGRLYPVHDRGGAEEIYTI